MPFLLPNQQRQSTEQYRDSVDNTVEENSSVFSLDECKMAKIYRIVQVKLNQLV